MKQIFVYGTLMKGERASGMLENGIYIGEYELKEYAAYDLGSFPGIVENKGGTVVGELYEVPDSVLDRLDIYEGEGALYKRVYVTVQNEKKTIENVLVYVYLGSISGCDCIRGRWKSID